MSETFDAVIVGAGPAGISAACLLAEKGASTIVLERGEYPGSKNMYGGVLYGHDLARVIPDFAERNCPIERNIVESRIWFVSQDGGYSVSYRDRAFESSARYNAMTVGRAKFDRWFADQAKGKGALLVCSTVVTDLLRDPAGRIVGVRTDRPEGDLRARVVLLADGVNSPLARKTGFRPEPRPEHVALAVKEVIALPEEVVNERFGVESGDGVTVEILGDITQGMNGIAFLYTNKSSVSLGIGANLADFARHRARPYEMIEALKTHPMVAPCIKGGKSREYMAHWLAEGGYQTIPQLCGDGYLIAGDSAEEESAILWRREMIRGGYVPAMLTVATPQGVVSALVFGPNEAHADYVGALSLEDTAAIIAKAAGVMGTNRDYLEQVARQLDTLDIQDDYVEQLIQLVRGIGNT